MKKTPFSIQEHALLACRRRPSWGKKGVFFLAVYNLLISCGLCTAIFYAPYPFLPDVYTYLCNNFSWLRMTLIKRIKNVHDGPRMDWTELRMTLISRIRNALCVQRVCWTKLRMTLIKRIKNVHDGPRMDWTELRMTLISRIRNTLCVQRMCWTKLRMPRISWIEMLPHVRRKA